MSQFGLPVCDPVEEALDPEYNSSINKPEDKLPKLKFNKFS